MQSVEQRLADLERNHHTLKERFDELQAALIFQNIRTIAEPPPRPPHTLPKKYTGPDAQLIDVPPIDPPNRYDEHVQETQGPAT